MFPMTASLRRVYRATAYVVRLPGREVELRIGSRPPALPWNLFRQAVFVAACNPGGRLRPATANTRAHRRLTASLRRAGACALAGEGRGDSGDWPPERSLLVFGVRREAAAALGRRLRQNAVLWLVRGRSVQLLALR
jgi:hypothetical protein